MKGQFVFACGMAPREFESNAASVDDLVTQRFGSMLAFQDLGGSVELYPESAEPMQDVTQDELVEFVEEAPTKPVSKSTKKRVAAQGEGDK